ncbi:hypothetical protein ACGF7W_35700 [Streptomyces sp. NPDC048219]|uniref:hypothetical protein n=1 Tax=Streptomyces sp. NPDC048219 TaxID=3365517 RepID=UPI00371748FA
MPLPIALFGVTALVNLLAVAADLPAWEWATKPLLAPLLALHLWRTTGGRHRSVLAGLGLATAGDVAAAGRPACEDVTAMLLGVFLSTAADDESARTGRRDAATRPRDVMTEAG